MFNTERKGFHPFLWAMVQWVSGKITAGWWMEPAISWSVSRSFQDDNLWSTQLPSPHSVFHSALTSSLLFVFIFSLIILPLLQTDTTSGPLLVAGYEDGSLMLWDVTQRSIVSSVKPHPEPVMCLTFDTKRLRGVSGSSEKKLASWTLDRQQNLQVRSRTFLRDSVLSGLSNPCSFNVQQNQGLKTFNKWLIIPIF